MAHAPTQDERDKALQAVTALANGRRLIFASFHGSRLYGTSTEDSDLDVRGVVLPTPEEVLLGRAKFALTSNTEHKALGKDDVDVTLFSLEKFLLLLGKFDVNAVEMLYAADPSNPCLLDHQPYLVHRLHEVAPSLVGMADSSPIGHARSALGALAPDQDGFVEVFQQAVDLINAALPTDDPTGASTKLYALPSLLAALRALPGGAYSAHGSHAQAITLEQDIPPEALQAGRWPSHTIFVHVGDRKLPTSVTLEESLIVLRKPLQRMVGELLARRARLEGVAVSTKDVYHAVRILWQYVELQATGALVFPRPQAPMLRDIRSGRLTGPALMAVIEEAFQAVITARALPMPFRDTPDSAVRDKLLVDLHGEVVFGG